MPDTNDIEASLARECLAVLGGLEPTEPGPAFPAGCRSLLLIGPENPVFWPHFTASQEFRDGAADPLDRWSKRILTAIAARHGGRALFPSDGPPYPPFYDWALESGAFAASPLNMLAHAKDGLMVSLRGALVLPFSMAAPDWGPPPCGRCEAQPCRDACPVGAFPTGQYAVDACHNHLDTSAGSDCMVRGCAARRACPASERSGREPAQSAFHMRAFHGKR
ncbi:ferredoxin [Aliiruegeria lutimaris]|uniref:ferredoxin n=1 Tax=Aliiruegeria lutimaris TaxID=571298 RepID=UPI000A62F0A9|nr:ferredoxin [Aliiruegeria lutimaris]